MFKEIVLIQTGLGLNTLIFEKCLVRGNLPEGFGSTVPGTSSKGKCDRRIGSRYFKFSVGKGS